MINGEECSEARLRKGRATPGGAKDAWMNPLKMAAEGASSNGVAFDAAFARLLEADDAELVGSKFGEPECESKCCVLSFHDNP